ncbi:hypothetical protein C4J81_04385 [Deltaproteobacteria bacterium Smac51]|nr:hypothetical protein C4J81_04385 [Deltaproteobacteria bacterium Smac51]
MPSNSKYKLFSLNWLPGATHKAWFLLRERHLMPQNQSLALHLPCGRPSIFEKAACFIGNQAHNRAPGIALVALLIAGVVGCAHVSWGNSGPEAQSYYYFIKSNYKEMAHDDEEAVKNMAKASSLSQESYYLKLEAARLYSRTGDSASALRYAQSAIDLNPGGTEAQLFAAWVAATSSNWTEAEKQYMDVLRLEPGNLEALTYLAALYAETGRPEEAETAFKRLVTVEPTYLSYYYLGSFYAKAGRPKDAISAFETSVKKSPEFTAALTELALLYEQADDSRSAERSYRALIKARPEASMPKARLARLLLKTGRKKEAEKLLAEVGGRAMDSTQAQLQIGLIYLDQSLYNEAAAEFEAVLKEDPSSDQARYLLASALMEKGEIIKAREHLMRIPSTSDLFVDARLLLASTAHGDKQLRLEEALAIVISAAKLRPDSPRLMVAEAMLLEELGNLPKARQVINEAAKQFPEEAEIQFRLGIIEDKMGNKNASIAAMKAAVDLNPRHAEALNYLAYTWAERKENLPQALSLAERADALKPNNGYIIDTIAWIHFMLGNDHKALMYLEQAVVLSEGDPVVMEHLGDVLSKLGRPEEALDAYLKAREGGAQNQEELNEKIDKLR